MSPRAIALQGIAFLKRLVALQGLWPDEEIPDEPKPDIFPGARIVRHKDNDDDVLIFLL